MLDESLAAFVQEGLAINIGTRNARLEPNGARVTAVRVDADRTTIVAYVPKVAAAPILADLKANGQGALGFARPSDDRACQVKGEFVEAWPATAADRRFVQAQLQGSVAQLGMVGIPPEALACWVTWPCVAIRLRITATFTQTPGPGAGAPLS
jgi:hypothetical protein